MRKTIYALVSATFALLLLHSPNAAAQFTMYYGGEQVYRQVEGTPDSIVLSFTPPNVRASQARDASTVGGTIAQASDAVDLGLPSGTLWAPWNIGANSAGEAGAYFAWGEVQGGKDKKYTTYKYQPNTYWWFDWYHEFSDWNYVLKYEINDGQTQEDWYFKSRFVGDGKRTLDNEDDAARVNWGGSWRMPTTAEFKELVMMCKWEWKEAWEYEGAEYSGYLVTSYGNGNSIFLPAAGMWLDSFYGGEGCYWTSELSATDTSSANYLYFSYRHRDADGNCHRTMGLPIRAVCSGSNSAEE